MNDSQLFWTEGIIDAIALEGDAPLKFRLVPSGAFLIEVQSKKHVLFTKNAPDLTEAASRPENSAEKHEQKTPLPFLDAKLFACEKPQVRDGKEGLWFVPVILSATCPLSLLRNAKTGRETVRVGSKLQGIATGMAESPIPIASLMII